jgi:quercetin 2,3-dioxygenase
MITLRPAAERGQTIADWLDSRHTFSFGEYHDRQWHAFRSLRVINDDRITAGGGFGMHPHRDMEIITCLYSGALEHRDSLGNGSIIRPGDVQRMTAGTGITHSEFNPSPTEAARLLQIWLFPESRSLPPGYEQKRFEPHEKRGRLRLVASRTGRDGSVTIRQDADLHASVLEPGETVAHRFQSGRYGWLQVASGSVRLNDVILNSGDGAAISDVSHVELTGIEAGELLLFDLA